jgi:hypothetical protein
MNPRRLQKLQEFCALYQDFALSGDPKGIQFALTDIGPDAGLTQLQILGGLIDSQKVSGFRIHSYSVLSLWIISAGRHFFNHATAFTV